MNNLKKHANKGFSLVELIVVIAIMAILVGVAVPVYAQYIDKTNRAKDIQLVDEIKHAVEIAAAANNWAATATPGYIGAVVIKSNGTSVPDGTLKTDIQTALTETLGDLGNLKLAYDGWTGTLTGADANGTNLALIVSTSNFGSQENAGNLLKDVGSLTDDMKNVIGNEDWQEILLGTGFGAWLDSQNIDHSDTQAVSNAATLYVAMGTSNGIDEEAFLAAWMQPSLGVVSDEVNRLASVEGVSAMAALAAEYARAEAAVNYIDSVTGATGEDSLRHAFTSQRITVAEGSAAGLATASASMQTVVNNVMTYLSDPSHTAAAAAFGAYMNSANNDNRKKDGQAYLALLKQVASSEDKIKEIGLDKESLYGSAELTGYVSSYISIADLLKNSGAGDKDVVIAFTMGANGAISSHTYPLDY